jgi:pantetheine-phosphate adenylyltransferase
MEILASEDLSYIDLKPRLFKCACVGGTFSPFHRGHERLLKTAFRLSEYVVIKLTTDDYINAQLKIRKELIQSYEKRKEKLEGILSIYEGRFEIIPLDREEDCINCKYKDQTDSIITGQDCLQKAYKINLKRRASDLYEVYIIGVPHILADDGKRISSTRIRLGEIDEYGHLLI